MQDVGAPCSSLMAVPNTSSTLVLFSLPSIQWWDFGINASWCCCHGSSLFLLDQSLGISFLKAHRRMVSYDDQLVFWLKSVALWTRSLWILVCSTLVCWFLCSVKVSLLQPHVASLSLSLSLAQLPLSSAPQLQTLSWFYILLCPKWLSPQCVWSFCICLFQSHLSFKIPEYLLLLQVVLLEQTHSY